MDTDLPKLTRPPRLAYNPSHNSSGPKGLRLPALAALCNRAPPSLPIPACAMLVKIAMLGDSQVGKTALMSKYVEGTFDDDYLQTLGVNFMDKTIDMQGQDVTFSIWDIGGHRDFASMLPMVCNDAAVILFVFDLSRRSTLDSVRTWYTQARSHNKNAIPILVGTKYDLLVTAPAEEQEEMTHRARQYAHAMRAPLIFCSPCYSVNVINTFKVILVVLFELGRTVREIRDVGRPIIEYSYVHGDGAHRPS
mmetsp:Transcript_25283/g.74233  ORF Transcript_25283/g.74233 Transcript_25283/m.74233 type:complete len:250 (+) Transcript_25283:3-752(+)